MKEYKIGEVARLLALTTQALRFYEQEGVITPRKTENGTRMYSVNQMVLLLSFKKYRQAEFTVQDIVEHFREDNVDSLLERLDDQSHRLVEKAGSLGGNTLIAGQGFNAADPERQGNMQMNETLRKELESYLEYDPADFGAFAEVLETVKGQIKEYLASGETYLFDTVELHMLHNYLGGKRTGMDGTVIEPDLALTRVFAENALDSLKWIESIGGGWNDETSTILGAMWPRSHGLATGNVIPTLERPRWMRALKS